MNDNQARAALTLALSRLEGVPAAHQAELLLPTVRALIADELDTFANFFATEYDDPFGEVAPDTVTAMLRDRAATLRKTTP